MGRLFGTDGVRGVANAELTPELAFKLGNSGAHVLSKDKEKPVVLIGKDTRLSGDMLEDALSAGILAVGGNVIKVGVLPTPAIAYLVRAYKADAGVVISASHNPFEYNGIKFFNGDGFKLDDEIEDEIEDIILRDIDVNSHITGDKLGRCLEADDDAIDRYAEFLKSTLDVDIKGRKLVLDCANGAAYKVAEKVYSELGADITVIGNEPNGVNINDACGSTHPEKQRRTAGRSGDGYRYEQYRLPQIRGRHGLQGRSNFRRGPVCAGKHAENRMQHRRRAVGTYHFPESYHDGRRYPVFAAAFAGGDPFWKASVGAFG